MTWFLSVVLTIINLLVLCWEMEILHCFLFSVADLKRNIFLPVWRSESGKKSFFFTVTPQKFVYFLVFRETLTQNIPFSQCCTRLLWNCKENSSLCVCVYIYIIFISGAQRHEVALMNGLTVNLHLQMVCLLQCLFDAVLTNFSFICEWC